MQRGRIIVVSGLPGAGKSTTSRSLAQRLDRAAHVEADEMHRLIVSGGVWPQGDTWSAEATRQLRLRLRNACLVAESFASEGFDAVVDDIVIGDRVAHLLQELPVPFHMITLAPSWESLVARWQGMDSPFIDEWAWMQAELAGSRRLGLWLDTTLLTPDEVVNEVLDRLSEALVITDH